MELTGKITGISTNFFTNKCEVTVAVNEASAVASGYDKLKDADLLDIVIKKHRNRRSLDANAYFHVLIGKIADCLGLSKTRAKNLMICRYGQQEFIDDQPVIIKTNIPVEKMLEQEFLHCQACRAEYEGFTEVIFYKVFRGSHTYDTKEMSVLIDGTVSEAKEIGIETMTPDQIERLVSAWQGKESPRS